MEFQTVLWSEHAERRFAERRLISSRHMVEETVRQPEQRYIDPEHPDRFIAHRRYARNRGPLLLRVFYVDAGNGTAVIVSCYPTFNVARYWRTDQ